MFVHGLLFALFFINVLARDTGRSCNKIKPKTLKIILQHTKLLPDTLKLLKVVLLNPRRIICA